METSPLTVTITGPRGAGKTTLLQLIISAIKDHKKVGKIQLPTHQVGEPEMFTVSLLK